MYLIYSLLFTLGALVTAPYYLWKRRDELAGHAGGNDSASCQNHSSNRSGRHLDSRRFGRRDLGGREVDARDQAVFPAGRFS